MRRFGPVLGALAGCGLGFLLLQQITTGAFDALEARQVAQDADRIRIGLDGQARLLTAFGATNAVWDDSYQDLKDADRAGFAEDFPPDATHAVSDLDALLGVSPTGELIAGGYVTDAAGFGAPAPQLTDPALLSRLYDPAGRPGAARCGVVSADAMYLSCGVAVYPSSGEGTPSGGLVLLKRLSPDRLRTLSADIDLTTQVVAQRRADGVAQPTVTSLLGPVEVSTSVLNADSIALNADISTVDGQTLILESVRDRLIHAAATSTAGKLFVLIAGATLLLVVLMTVSTRRAVRRRVRPLRRTTEQIVASGNHNLRIGATGDDDIAAPGRAIDTMLDTISSRDRLLQTEQEQRQRELQESHGRQSAAERETREQARQLVADRGGPGRGRRPGLRRGGQRGQDAGRHHRRRRADDHRAGRHRGRPHRRGQRGHRPPRRTGHPPLTGPVSSSAGARPRTWRRRASAVPVPRSKTLVDI